MNIINLISSKFGDRYTYEVLEQNDINSLSLIRVSCKDHGEVIEGLFINLMHQSCLCQKCRESIEGVEEGLEMKPKVSRKKWELVELIEEFEKIHGNRFLYHDLPYSYKNMKSPIWIKCIKHNHFFQQLPSNHKTSKICCDKCLEELTNS